jgi:cytochrome c6
MKNSKLIVTLVLGFAFIYISCQGKKSETTSEASAPATTPTETATAPAVPVNAEGKKVFETYCILCHGADGKLGLNGSKDLSVSTVTLEERINQVTNGKNTMTPFKDILTEAEIKAVCEYTLSLKQ